MFNEPQIQHSYDQNICTLCIPLAKAGDITTGKPIENVKNCDIFVEENNFLIFIDVKLYRLYSPRKFCIADLNQLDVVYDTKERVLKLSLPCEPPCNNTDSEITNDSENKLTQKFWRFDHDLELWKLKRITSCCRIRYDNNTESQKLDSSFCYGFASKFSGKIRSGECDLDIISRMTEPNLSSPLLRSIEREIDELKDFDRDEYKLNFIDLLVPVGHDNPMDFNILWDEDCQLTQSEECLLHNLSVKTEHTLMPEKFSQTEIDCGLISILLAICYDVRTTSNEPTCESGWTRSILTPTLYYHEPFTSVREVVIAFLRRSLIYPLYRNYDLGHLCVEDVIDALHRSSRWVAKQLLVTEELFASSHSSREIFNRYYIDDYIRYVCNDNYCPTSHLQMLSNNLKNVLYDISKKHLRLDLTNIESEVLKEFIPQDSLQINAPTTSEEETTTDDDDVDDDEDDDEDDEYLTETSSASETDENSVIEQCIEEFKP